LRVLHPLKIDRYRRFHIDQRPAFRGVSSSTSFFSAG
jgi:hypothetical protein